MEHRTGPAAPHISIHAPREGSDRGGTARAGRSSTDFYPRSPRGERPGSYLMAGILWVFLSTLPARGATAPGNAWHPGQPDFYPRSPRGERRRAVPALGQKHDFYPRSPRGERLDTNPYHKGSVKFLSTLPARGATCLILIIPQKRIISIHAPREGSDGRVGQNLAGHLHFYPRSPRGERLSNPDPP